MYFDISENSEGAKSQTTSTEFAGWSKRPLFSPARPQRTEIRCFPGEAAALNVAFVQSRITYHASRLRRAEREQSLGRGGFRCAGAGWVRRATFSTSCWGWSRKKGVMRCNTG
jgi:hypothetical protein